MNPKHCSLNVSQPEAGKGICQRRIPGTGYKNSRKTYHLRGSRAFSLIELLCVMGICVTLTALFLPALHQSQLRAERVKCKGNLRQLALAFNSFAHEHEDRYPMQTPMSEGGTAEYVRNGYRVGSDFFFTYRHFQALSNELGGALINHLVCPSDDARVPVTTFAKLNNQHLSYFVGVNAESHKSLAILAGDRNLTANQSRNQTIMSTKTGGAIRWTADLHRYKGNLLFADGHVEEQNSMHIPISQVVTGDLFLPVLRFETTAKALGGTDTNRAKRVTNRDTEMAKPSLLMSGKGGGKQRTPSTTGTGQGADQNPGQAQGEENASTSKVQSLLTLDKAAAIGAGMAETNNSMEAEVKIATDDDNDQELVTVAPVLKKPPIKRWLATMAPITEDGHTWPFWLLLVLLVALMYLHRRWSQYMRQKAS